MRLLIYFVELRDDIISNIHNVQTKRSLFKERTCFIWSHVAISGIELENEEGCWWMRPKIMWIKLKYYLVLGLKSGSFVFAGFSCASVLSPPNSQITLLYTKSVSCVSAFFEFRSTSTELSTHQSLRFSLFFSSPLCNVTFVKWFTFLSQFSKWWGPKRKTQRQEGWKRRVIFNNEPVVQNPRFNMWVTKLTTNRLIQVKPKWNTNNKKSTNQKYTDRNLKTCGQKTRGGDRRTDTEREKDKDLKEGRQIRPKWN